MIILNELNKQFKNKYDFLQVLSVVYDTQNSFCEIIFLYPEKNEDLKQEEKNEIIEFLQKSLDLSCQLKVKFKKSYLDDELIKNALINHLDMTYPSVFSLFTADKVIVEKKETIISITLNLNNTVYEYFTTNNLQIACMDFLKKNFISSFDLQAKQDSSIVMNDSILEKRTNDFYANVKPPEVVKRYEVFEPESLIGALITPMPEMIRYIKSEKTDVILAGEVSLLKEGTYISRRTKKAGGTEPSFYYSFTLTDHTGKMSAIYFANKTTLKQIRKIKDGDKILVVGNVKQGQRDLSLHIKSLSLCEIGEMKIEREENVEAELYSPAHIENYSVVTPYVYMQNTQETLFEKPKVYNQDFLGKEYVVFDCETTGLDPSYCDITEIGAVKVVNGKIKEVFQTLLKPSHEIPEEVIKLTGITNEMVANAPDPTKVIMDFYKFCEGSILSGYNVNFDVSFIQALAKKAGIKFPNEVFDVLTFAKQKLYLPRYKLINVVEHLGLKLNNAHRALFDATATAEVLQKLNEIE